MPCETALEPTSETVLETFLKLNLEKLLGLVPSVSGEMFPEVALEVIVAIRLS